MEPMEKFLSDYEVSKEEREFRLIHAAKHNISYN